MLKWLILLLLSLLYSIITVIMKVISSYPQMGVEWILGYCFILFLFFLYAIFWQQILKRVTLVTAYVFKSSCIIFTVLLSMLFFGETISLTNILGCLIIISGIVLMFS